ncbi:MAG: hypothetical protein IPM45_03285 [Acidimicrobiales bacterium]|nr:hypothetical protein [Acidimicrobiales bacterium]
MEIGAAHGGRARPRPGPTTLGVLAVLATFAAGLAAASAPAGAEPRPLRVLLVGDEVMAQAGPELATRLTRTGLALVVAQAARPGTGMAGTFDWPAELDRLLDATGAELVVAHFGGADTPPWAPGPDGAPAAPGSPAWLNRWGSGVLALMDVATAHDARVLWVVPPPDGDPARAITTEMIAVGQQALLASYPGRVSFADARRRLAGPDGGFTATVPGPGGATMALRAEDGYGLAPEGAHRLAELVADQIIREWCLDPTGSGCVPSFGGPPPTPVAPAGRPRVLLVGDSIAFQVAPRLQALLEGSGRAWVHAAHHSTAGLVSSSYDWAARIRAEAEAFRPDVVLVDLEGGYRPPWVREAGGAEIPPGSFAYAAEWLRRADDLTANLVAGGARVVWLLSSELYGRDDGGRLTLGPLWHALSQRFGARVDALDGWEALGRTTLLPPPDRPATRLPDLGHLTAYGADRYARLLVADLEADGCLVGPGACAAPTA